jgi:hypothetical protein
MTVRKRQVFKNATVKIWKIFQKYDHYDKINIKKNATVR